MSSKWFPVSYLKRSIVSDRAFQTQIRVWRDTASFGDPPFRPHRASLLLVRLWKSSGNLFIYW